MTVSSHKQGDSYAWGESFLSRIDPRIKIAGAAGLLLGNLLSDSLLAPGILCLAMALLMIGGRIPYRRQLLMIAFPSTFALFVLASQTLFMGESVVANLGPFDLHSDGFAHGAFLALRLVAGGLVIVVLGVSTPVNRLCQALRWFRVPATFVEVLQLAYRYLFDIYAELFRMKEAQRSRLGWSSARAGLGSSRMLGGALFLRVYDRGLRSAEAMRCRGDGSLVTGELPAPGRLDLAAALTALALIAALVALSVFEFIP